jgi:hypothetical protein
MVALDVFTDRPDLVRLFPLRRAAALEIWKWLRAAEEALKLVGAALFLATALACLRIARADDVAQTGPARYGRVGSGREGANVR